MHFCSSLAVHDGVFVNFDTLDGTLPNFSRAFGARAVVSGYVDRGARQNEVLRECMRRVDFKFLLKPYSLGQTFCKF